MAKIYGLFGAMTGKVADAVMVVRNGEQIVRKYQPVVSNPSSPAQVATRAKLKLLSQLSAVMAPVIAIPRQGSVSSRNIFTKVNYPLTSFANSEAAITLTGVQLTKSAVALSRLFAVRGEGYIEASLATDGVTGGGEVASLGYSRVVYTMFVKGADQKLRFVTSQVATEAGSHNEWMVRLPSTNLEVVILAYAVRDNTEAARTTFGNLTAVTAETVATVLTSRTLLESDVTVTETQGIQLAASSNREEGSAEKKKTSAKS